MFVCLSAWARVELTLNPNVEVFLGQSATILCQHTFKDISQEPSRVITQIFVVSPTWCRTRQRRKIFELSSEAFWPLVSQRQCFYIFENISLREITNKWLAKAD